jgi:hypothetical protein
MDAENLIENIDSILECAQAIKDDVENNPPEGSDLYDQLREGGYSIDFDEIVAALNIWEQASESGVDCKYDAAAAFEVWREWNDTGLCHNYGDLHDVNAYVELFDEYLCDLAEASGLHVTVVQGSSSDVIEALKGQGVSPAEKTLLNAVKAFIAATKE